MSRRAAVARRRPAPWRDTPLLGVLLHVALLLAALAAPAHRAAAQNTSTMTVTYTSLLAASPGAADFTAGRVVAGYADVAISWCGRSRCQLRMAATTPGQAGVASVRYVVAASTPSLASCSTLLSTSALDTAPIIATLAAGQTSGSVRVYFCLDLSWTGTPPVSWSPGVTFRLQQGQ